MSDKKTNDAAESTQTVAPETPVKEKKQAKAKTADASASALRAVGAAACKRHKLAQVWVTSDGQAFPQESDAKAHARNLPSKETIKVTAK